MVRCPYCGFLIIAASAWTGPEPECKPGILCPECGEFIADEEFDEELGYEEDDDEVD